jgi:hypothetical protein
MGIEVRGLDAVRQQLKRLMTATKVPVVTIEIPDTETQKIEWIVAGRKVGGKQVQAPRDILQLTPSLLGDMAAAFAKALPKALLGDKDGPWKAAAEVYLKTLQNRIGFSGGDIASKLAPLKESTQARKGGNTRLFYDSGDLLKAIMKARIKVRR